MNFSKKGYLFVILCLGFVSFLQADPTITTKGSLEISGTAISNGGSFVRTKTQIGLEFNFTDTIKGVVRASKENTENPTPAVFQESYIIVPSKEWLFRSLSAVNNETTIENTPISEKSLEKIVRAVSRTLFPTETKLVQQTDTPAKTKQPQPGEKITRLRSTKNYSNLDLSS